MRARPAPEPLRVHLSVDDLACRRAGRLVLRGVSLALGPGGALLVTGRNGAGKSTLLAAIAGLVRPSGGTVAAAGLDGRTLGESLHLVAHRDGLKSALTAAENLAFAGAILGRPEAAAEEALERVGLAGAARLQVGYLSAGQRRRVALARLLVCRRPLWLLDEPTTALDSVAQDLLVGLIERHRETGGLLIAATHAALPLAGAAELRLDRAPDPAA